ncbi:hypothetical protein [uncultured Friedmanniella sp.]|uniref:hypothetical protein n=1 Tax=uncultured Friedmanniella sp. TaxID=335381 RepID=UPI0035CA7E15
MNAYRCAAGWAVTTLLADPEVTAVVGDRVYEGLAPKSAAAYPLLTVQSYGDPVDTNYQGSRALTTVEVIVRVWDSVPDSKPSSAGRIAPAADRIDALLSPVYNVVRPGGVICSSERIAEVASTEFRDGNVVRALGGRFTVVVGALPE